MRSVSAPPRYLRETEDVGEGQNDVHEGGRGEEWTEEDALFLLPFTTGDARGTRGYTSAWNTSSEGKDSVRRRQDGSPQSLAGSGIFPPISFHQHPVSNADDILRMVGDLEDFPAPDYLEVNLLLFHYISKSISLYVASCFSFLS